jgi:hypothetical protein
MELSGWGSMVATAVRENALKISPQIEVRIENVDSDPLS